MLTGCTSAAPPPASGQLPTYSDGTEYFVPTMRDPVPRTQVGTAGVTHYFLINSKQVCYSFQVPGVWHLGSEPGVLRRLDDNGAVRVVLFGIAELGGGSAESAIRKAAERSGERFTRERAGAPWSLAPYPGAAGAWSWTVPTVASIVPRWYLPAGDAWIAQFAIGVPSEVVADRFVDDVLNSLTTSREPRCYEARLRELGGIR
jgi:hypothetical protein